MEFEKHPVRKGVVKIDEKWEWEIENEITFGNNIPKLLIEWDESQLKRFLSHKYPNGYDLGDESFRKEIGKRGRFVISYNRSEKAFFWDDVCVCSPYFSQQWGIMNTVWYGVKN